MNDPHAFAFIYLLVAGGIGMVAAIGFGLYLNRRERLERKRRQRACRKRRHGKAPR